MEKRTKSEFQEELMLNVANNKDRNKFINEIIEKMKNIPNMNEEEKNKEFEIENINDLKNEIVRYKRIRNNINSIIKLNDKKRNNS